MAAGQESRPVRKPGTPALRLDLLPLPKRIRFFLIDPDPLVHRCFRKAFKAQRGFQLKGCFARCTDALEWMANEEVDLVVTEARLGGMDSLRLIRTLKTGEKPVRTVVLTSISDPFARDHVLRAGADAFLLKPCNLDALLLSMKAAFVGVQLCSLARPVAAHVASDSGFTLIQQLILRRIGGDLSLQQIADELGVELSTVRTHFARLRKRFGVHNNAALLQHCSNQFPDVFRDV
jgi:DNA-binding NarL/FixJ family response regulator